MEEAKRHPVGTHAYQSCSLTERQQTRTHTQMTSKFFSPPSMLAMVQLHPVASCQYDHIYMSHSTPAAPLSAPKDFDQAMWIALIVPANVQILESLPYCMLPLPIALRSGLHLTIVGLGLVQVPFVRFVIPFVFRWFALHFRFPF